MLLQVIIFIICILIMWGGAIVALYENKIIGAKGESKVANQLSNLNRKDYKVLHNIVLQIGQRTTQIDHIVVSRYGIFVIETKNVKGWIFGGEYSQYWTQTIFKNKYCFYNPILQNATHVEAVRKCLTSYPLLFYKSIVVFSSRAELKVKTSTDVIYIKDLCKLISSYSTERLTFNEVEEIYQTINANNVGSTVSANHHKKAVKKWVKEKEKLIANNICPRCKRSLSIRKGKHGKFIGCSGFPHCKFTTQYKSKSILWFNN